MSLIALAEHGWLPDAVIRLGIRRLLRQRVTRARREYHDLDAFVQKLSESPIAIHTEDANRQHYEAPPEFFALALGPRLKYSCCLYPQHGAPLAKAEEAMLRLTCERAELADGQRILELGCGWGSLSLWMAQEYPRARITAISNSNRQRGFIQQRAAERGLKNLRVETADVVEYQAQGDYDRIVSVEMLEHMRNYEALFQRMDEWLAPRGKVFVHVFRHSEEPYLFEAEGTDNWMGRHFFTGGTMPSKDLFARFNKHLCIRHEWRVDGLHYWRTCEDWLRNLDRRRDAALGVFLRDLPMNEARLTLQRWRIFFMACAELFRFEGGRRWCVGHYLFTPNGDDSDTRTAEPAQAAFAQT